MGMKTHKGAKKEAPRNWRKKVIQSGSRSTKDDKRRILN
jgi:hypothetical protein